VALSQGSEKLDEQRRFDIEDQLRHSRTLPKVCQKLLFEAFLKRAQQLSKTPANACAFCELTALHSSLSDEQRHQTQAYFAERETKA